jgi:hypothetical protein
MLLKKVTLISEPSYMSTFSSSVSIHTYDGRIFEDTTNLKQERSDKEKDRIDAYAKFEQIVEPRIGQAKFYKLKDLIFNLESVKDLNTITSLLNRGVVKQ